MTHPTPQTAPEPGHSCCPLCGARALREFDTDAMAEALGGKSAWLTSASHVANIVRYWLDEAADEIEASA